MVVGNGRASIEVRTARPSTSPRAPRCPRAIVQPLPARVCRVVRESPCPFRPEARGESVSVEDVVDGLEEDAELLAERAPRRLFARGRAGREQAEADRRREQAAGLQLLDLGEVASSPVMSRYWPPIIPSVASASSRAMAGSSYDSASRNASASSASPASSATPSPKRDVRARAPAPLVVVVERREVVVDERERVHELDAPRPRQRVLDVAARRLGDGEAEHGPDPLARRSSA